MLVKRFTAKTLIFSVLNVFPIPQTSLKYNLKKVEFFPVRSCASSFANLPSTYAPVRRSMPVPISCPSCNKRYHLPETMLGKSVRCKQCNTAFVAGGAQPAAQVASRPNDLSQEQMNEFGIEGNIAPEPEIFGAPSGPAAGAALGNYAGEDPGFGGGDMKIPLPSSTAGDNTNPYAAVLNNPALRPKKKRKKSDDLADAVRIREDNIGWECLITQWGTFIAFTGVAGLIFFVLAIIGIASGASLPEGAEPSSLSLMLLIPSIIFVVAMYIFSISVGIGMRNLTSYGRISSTILAGIGLLAIGPGTLLSAWILYLLWAGPSTLIFSEEYRKVVNQTPHIQRTPYLLYILIGVLFVLPIVISFILFFVGAIAGLATS